MSTLKVIKLVTGEELLAFIEEYSSADINSVGNTEYEESDIQDYTYDHLLFIRDPLKIMCQYNVQEKKYSMFLIRWTASTDDSLFAIPKSLVITICEPIPDLIEHYHEVKAEDLTILNGIKPNNQIETLTKDELEKNKLKEFLENYDFDDKKDKH